MTRAAVTSLALAIVTVAALAVLWALQTGTTDPGTGPGDVTEKPTVVKADPVEARIHEHRQWPFLEFQRDIELLRLPPDARGQETEENLANANGRKVYFETVDLDFEGGIADLVKVLNEQLLKDTGVPIRVGELGQGVGELRFKLRKRGVQVDHLIDELRMQSDERLKYYMTSEGLWFGSEGDIIQAQLDAREHLGRKQAAADHDGPMLAVEFRPDFADAWVSSIIRLIRDQTGVQVVADAETWNNGRKVTWRANPMTLREALDRICKELHCLYRVKDGRVFLLHP